MCTVDFILFSLLHFQVPESFLEAEEELNLPVGDISECRTKCRDETRFVCRYETMETSQTAKMIYQVTFL